MERDYNSGVQMAAALCVCVCVCGLRLAVLADRM